MTSSTTYSRPHPLWQNPPLLIVGVLLTAILGLSVVSWMELCSAACSEAHRYTLLGLPFEALGFLLFGAALGFWAMALRDPAFLLPLKVIVASALGAEVYFLYIQKFVIGKWCPVCVTIFVCIAAIASIFAYDYLQRLRHSAQPEERSHLMPHVVNGLGTLSIVVFGFAVAFFGVIKTEDSFAAEVGQEAVYFGKKSSPVDVYIFTDWVCPSCRKVEPQIERQFGLWAQKARVFFIDFVIHKESMNFIPYNLSFMLKEKDRYIKLRHQLADLSTKDTTPTEADIDAIALKAGTTYKQLDYSEVNLGTKYFQQVSSKYGVDSTPTIVIVNPATKKMKKLSGVKEISSANVSAIIDKLAK